MLEISDSDIEDVATTTATSAVTGPQSPSYRRDHTTYENPWCEKAQKGDAAESIPPDYSTLKQELLLPTPSSKGPPID